MRRCLRPGILLQGHRSQVTGEQLEFVRLIEVPLTQVTSLLNEPRNTRHMPLSGEFTEASAAEWVAAKDAQWERNGYGPWAVLWDGELAGWGGFQREDNGADYALVLRPEHWGHGADITRAALDRGFRDLGLDSVIIALAPSGRACRDRGVPSVRPFGELVLSALPLDEACGP